MESEMNDTAKTLVVTRMDGPEDAAGEELERPTWRDIETAILRLDGDACTLLVLGIGEPPVPHMAIGGGENSKYIIYATRNNRTFHNLIAPRAVAGRSLLVAGGQWGEYPNKQLVGLEEALRAARTYAETGQLEPTLVWEKQG